MFKYILLSFLFFLDVAVYSKNIAPPPDSSAVGVAVGHRTSLYKQGNVPFPVLPFFVIKQGRFSLQGISMSYAFYQGFPSLHVVLSPNLLMLKDKGGISKGLHTRYWTVQGGFRLTFPFPVAILSFQWEHDLFGRYRGNIYSINIRRMFSLTNQLFLTFSPFVRFYDSAYVNYYFGVSQEEATNFRPFYQGKRAFEYGAALSLAYRVNERNSVNLLVSESFVDRRISNSPLVKQHTTYSYYISWGYYF